MADPCPICGADRVLVVAKLLTRLRTGEVSSVDRGAGEGVKIVLMKRDDAADRRDHRERRRPQIDKRLENIFEAYLGDGRPLLRKRTKAGSGDAWAQYRRDHARELERRRNDMVGRGGELGETWKQVRDLAGAQALLLSHSSASRELNALLSGVPFVERAAALLRLARTLRGEAGGNDAGGDQTNKRGTTMRTTRTMTISKAEALQAIIKQHGAAKLCKMIVDDGDAHGITERELSQAIMATVALCDGETPEMGFARIYCADNADGLAMRKAVQLAKMTVYIGDDVATMSMDREGLPVRYSPRLIAEGRDALDMGGDGGIESDADADDQDDAMDVLNAATEKMHSQHPEMTREQCFAKIYTSQAYSKVATRERIAGRAKIRKAMGFA